MRLLAVALSALVATGLSGSAPLHAQETVTPIVIRAARMVDVVGGQLVRNPVLVIEGDRITAVNPASAPRNARTVDLGDVTLLPGLIDLHTHLSMEIGASSFTAAATTTPAAEAFNTVQYALRTINAGVTTVRDFGGDNTVALGHAIEKGIITGPHVVPSRNPLGITGGHCDLTGFAPGVLEQRVEDGVADGPWDVVRAVRYQIKHGAQVIKTCATAGVLSLEGPVGAQQYTYEELKAMVDEAARHGVRVAAHAHGNAGIKAAVRAGVTSIEHGSELDDEAVALMKQHGTYLVPTTYLVGRINLAILPPMVRRKAESILPIAQASLRKAIASGVKIGFGTDAGVYPHGENARELALYVKYGMSSIDALRSATVHAADVLGKTDRGVIEAGRLADLIAVPGDPLQDITATERVSWVMHAGKVVKGTGAP